MCDTWNKLLPWTLIALGTGFVWLTADWSPVRFVGITPEQVMSHFGVLVFFSLLLERTVEVFFTIWRSEESYKLNEAVRSLKSAGKAEDDQDLKAAREKLNKYRAATQRLALPCTFLLGLLLAGFGVRVFDKFLLIDSSVLAAQKQWLHISDIVLTAALLAGGADPIHKVMDAFRKFMEATSAKAGGTNPS